MVALLFTGIIHAITDLETDRKIIITILSQSQPALVQEFKALCNHYDESVFQFFDKKNNNSLATHVAYMESEIEIFKKVGDDIRYRTVQPLVYEYYYYLKDLLAIVKRYIGSWDTLTLALKLRKFKPILPIDIRNRGDFALFWSLNHRLHC